MEYEMVVGEGAGLENGVTLSAGGEAFGAGRAGLVLGVLYGAKARARNDAGYPLSAQ